MKPLPSLPHCLLLLLLTSCSAEPASTWQVRTLVNGQLVKLAKVSPTADTPRKGWQPEGLAVSAEGLVYFSDRENHRVLSITPTGVVQEFAGNGEAGDQEGTSDKARLRNPAGLALGSEGQLYLADSGNHVLREISATGEVKTLALSRQIDLKTPFSVLAGPNKSLYVADSASGRIFYLTERVQQVLQTAPTLLPEALAPLAPLAPNAQGHLLYADLQGLWQLEKNETRTLLRRHDSQLRRVRSLISDGKNGYFLSDPYLHRVLHWVPGGPLEAIAGGPDAGNKDGKGDEARFAFPGSLAKGPAGELYLADTRNNRICKLTPNAQGRYLVSTLARSGTQGFGERRAGEDLSLPHGVLYDARSHNYVVSDYLHNRLFKISAEGIATPWFEPTETNGEPLVLPAGLAQGPDGSIYVSGSGRHRIHKISPEGKISVLAGSGKVGFKDGKGKEAQFYLPFGLAVGPDNAVYVADQGNHAIRKIASDGTVSTLAGNGEAGWRDALGSAARFNKPSGLALHPDGSLWVADSWNHRLRRITPQGQVSTALGDKVPGQAGFEPERDHENSLYVPEGLAINASGEVFIADSWNHRIRKWEPKTSRLLTLAGSGKYLNFGGGYADGPGRDALFSQPKGVALGPQGQVLVADTGNHRIRVLEP